MHIQIQVEGWGHCPWKKKKKAINAKNQVSYLPSTMTEFGVAIRYYYIINHFEFQRMIFSCLPLRVLRLTTNSGWHSHAEVGTLPSPEQAQPSVGLELVERSRQACSPCSSNHHTQLGPAAGAAHSLSVSHWHIQAKSSLTNAEHCFQDKHRWTLQWEFTSVQLARASQAYTPYTTKISLSFSLPLFTFLRHISHPVFKTLVNCMGNLMWHGVMNNCLLEWP